MLVINRVKVELNTRIPLAEMVVKTQKGGNGADLRHRDVLDG